MKQKTVSIKHLVFICFMLLASCKPATVTTRQPSIIQRDQSTPPSSGRTKIKWFIGVDTGRTPQAVRTAEEFVDKFNNSQEIIELEMEVVTSSTHDAIDRLMAKIEEGNPPDVIAPADMGWAGEQLSGRMLPIDATLYNLSDIESRALDSWRVDGKLMGLPAGVFPSVIFYNKALFDTANLPYPPHEFGKNYADGDPWTIDKMEAIAMQLTLDNKGRNATDPEYDPRSAVQWGFHWQWDSTRSMAVMFGAGSVVDESGNAVIPQQWREAFHWYYDGMWQKYFIPTSTQVASMKSDPFLSGKVAMVHTFMWYSPRLADNSNWDIAAVPAYKGTITTRMQRDGVIILNTTTHPEEAYQVAYAIATNPDLLLAWEMLPTLKSLQQRYLADLKAKHPGIDWQVMVDSLDYTDTTYENGMPNYRKAYDRLLAFRDLISMKGDLSLDSEISKLVFDLQTLFDEAP